MTTKQQIIENIKQLRKRQKNYKNKKGLWMNVEEKIKHLTKLLRKEQNKNESI